MRLRQLDGGTDRLLARPAVLTDEVVTIVDELFSNSLRHTASGLPNGKTRLEISHYADRVRIAVTDRGALPGCLPCEPRLLMIADDGVPSGFGLHLVDKLAVAWGWFGGPESHTVWAEVAQPEPRSSVLLADIRVLAELSGEQNLSGSGH